jgi:hypothetical protein
MKDDLAPDANVRHRPILLAEIARLGIAVHTGCTGRRVTAEGVVCADRDGNEKLVPGATVICALGQRSNRKDADELLDCAPHIAQIGDCVRVANITAAIYQGHHAASTSDPARRPKGTIA